MNIYELIGLIIGDGSIYYNPKKSQYRLSISGDVKEDRKYFEDISRFIFQLTSRKPNIVARKMLKGHCLELNTNNKKFVNFLINEMELPKGKKTFTVFIPEKFLNWKYSKHIIRELFESDGSLYFSKSKVIKYPSYPRIEIRTSSKKLANQAFILLKNKDFKVQFMKTKYKDYKIYLSGKEMLDKWVKEIGFSNESTISKHQLWEKLGYYIPRITFEQRKKLLKG